MNKILYRYIGYLYEPLCYLRTKKYLAAANCWKEIQQQELISVLSYAKTHSPYFHQLLSNKDINRDSAELVLKSLPILDKSIIRAEKVQSDEITSDWKSWANTGGSTGEPLRFPRMAATSKKRWEHINQMMLYIKMGYKPLDKIASFDGLRVDENLVKKKIFHSLRDKNFPYGIIRYSVLYLTSDSFIHYFNSLNTEQPKFIRSYPSGLLLFCKLLKESGLKLEFELRGCYLTSENFSQYDKDFISDILGCPVWGQYGHTESSVFAIQEPSSELYKCSPLYGYTEVLKEDGSHAAIGETGSLVITGFNNYGLPFIRYSTGDLAVYGGMNEYGEVLLSKLLGRDSDYIYDKKDNKVYLVGLIFGAHMHAFDCIDSWQIQQDTKGCIILKIVKGSDYSQESERELIDFFAINNIGLTIEYVSEIKKNKRGKQKFLIQNIKA